MTLPARMLAIDYAEAGGPEVLKPIEVSIPQPGPGEVLIRVEAAGVNRPDIMQRRGLYPAPPGASEILGLEIAGEVIAIGADVDPMISGMPVCALVTGGGYAQYAVAHAAHCLAVPATLTMVEAAALPETLFTVWTNIFQRAQAAAGDRVLVHGGTSGIGTMAIQLGRLFGLDVIVTCGSDEKCRSALAIGATHAINYQSADFVEAVKEVTGGAGVSIVLDMIGGDYLPRNLACLADDGRHVSIAVQRGAKAEIPIFTIMRRRLTLTGSTLRPRSAAYKASVAQEIERSVWGHVIQGRLKPIIDSVYPLADAAAAHARMDADHVGKVVLSVSH